MSNYVKISWLLFLCLPCLAHAQSRRQEAPSFTRYTMEQGLADNWVHVAMCDRHGFLWFGTEGGLTRFDGRNFFNFYEQKDAPGTLSNNTVRDISEDPDGTFWLAVLDGGLNHFDPATGKFESWKTDPATPKLKDQLLSLTSICQDGDLLWLGSYHHGLGCFDKKKHRFTGWYDLRQDSLNSHSFQYNSVNHVIQDHRQPRYLWAATAGRGLARFDKTTRTFDLVEIRDKQGFTGISAMKLVQDAQGKIWIATWSAGLASYDSTTGEVETFPYNVSLWEKVVTHRNISLAVLEKNEDELWIATQDNGFGVFDKKTGQYHFFQNALSGESPELDRYCQGLYLDPRQRLWVLGESGGARVFDFHRNSFRYISLASGDGKMEQAEVTAFGYSPRRKTVFVASENSGCYEWSDTEPSLTQRVLPLQGGAYPSFRALLCDSRGNIWAGAAKTLGGGASLYLLRPGQSFFEPAVLPLSPSRTLEETVNDIFEDSKGNIWIATSYDGIYKISPDNTSAVWYTHNRGFARGLPAFQMWWAFHSIKEDGRGHLWLGLKSGGVLDFDPATGAFLKYDAGNVLSSNISRSLETGADGSVWVGTNSSGVEVFQPGGHDKSSRTIISKEQGLPGNFISKMKKDDTGLMWIATGKGLAAYDPETSECRVFAKAEGLKNPFLKDKGLAVVPGLGVLVGQPNGFCLLPDTPGPGLNPEAAKVALTDFKVFDQSKYFEKNIRNATEIELAPSENVFAFGFSTPASLDAGLDSYQFMLEGFDEKWYTTDEPKSITYTGLAPGSYTFRVKAKATGNQETTETTLAIRILPNWWQTWWFWTLVAFAFLFLGWVILRYRTAQVRHEEQMKTEFYKQLSEKELTALRSQMNPHFIFNCLNSINNFIVRNDSQQAANYITKFSRLIRLVLDNSRSQKVPLEKELEALQLYIELEAMRFGEKFRYEIWVDDEVDEQFLQIPPLLIQPYVENAIWHGLMHKPEGGSVVVDVRQPAENRLCIEITDDGVGRKRAAELESKSSLQHKSHGTLITAERLHMLNPDKPEEGKVTLHDLVDAEGQPYGTKVVLEIPV